jgi:pimeloyl-ACP methyl ester carboxylesterase
MLILAAACSLLLGTPAFAQTAPAPAAAALLTAPDQQFSAGDVTLRYRDAGSGDPVILIHGYGTTLESMGGIAKALPQYRLIALDVRGFGRSSKFAAPARFGQQMVDDVIRLMDHLKLQRAHVLGHSMGALIAANVASRYPDRVATATLVAGPFYADEATFERETTRWTTDLESGKGLSNFMLWLFPAWKPEMAAMANAGAMKSNDLESLIAVMRSLPKLAIAGLPRNADKTLVVAGTGDPLFPLSPAFAKQSPGARLIEVAGADHVNVIANPEVVTAIRERLQQ